MITAVEIADGYTMFFHPFYGTPLVNVPPNLNTSQFHDFRLSTAHHSADFPVVGNLSSLYAHEKLFVWHWLKKADCSDHVTDDVVADRNLFVYTLGCSGNLYNVDIANNLVTKKLVIRALDDNGEDSFWFRKRVVKHPTMLKLYLVVRKKKQMFTVYKLSRKDANFWDRIEVVSFGVNKDKDSLVLFVTPDTCFFAYAKKFKGCHLRNCIVFSRDAFPPYSNADLELPRDGPGIYVYRLGETSHGFVPISSYPGFPCRLWYPPPWALQGSLSQSDSEGESESDQTDQVKKPFQSCQNRGISLQKQKQHECAADTATSVPIHEQQSIEFPSVDGEKATRSTAIHALDHVTGEGPHQETLSKGIIHSVSRAYITSINQSDYSGGSTVKFEGLDIRSSLVPTLQKIWSKHGNIIENCLMRNGDMIAKALESLANVVLILEGNSAQSLSDHQADYLSSTLSDLRCMCFKVDWLEPFVEKAVGLHKGKIVLDSLNKLNQLNVRATERRSILLDELAKVEEMQKELKEDLANLSKRIPFLEEMDLNLPLGVGLT